MLLSRILTVIFAAPILIAAILCPWTWVFKGVIAGSLVIALKEFLTLARFPRPELAFSLAAGLFQILFFLFCPVSLEKFSFELVALLILLFAFYCVSPGERYEGVAPRIGIAFLGIFYIGTCGSFIGLLREVPDGFFWTFALLTMTWLNDTAAYFIGHRFGRHRLAPLLSPGKTVEGFLGGFLGSFTGFLFCWLVFENPLSFVQGILLVLLTGIMGPLGDLSESLIKRSYGVKDSGDIIPGHGGMLDRIDALLFTAPAIYYFASIFSK